MSDPTYDNTDAFPEMRAEELAAMTATDLKAFEILRDLQFASGDFLDHSEMKAICDALMPVFDRIEALQQYIVAVKATGAAIEQQLAEANKTLHEKITRLEREAKAGRELHSEVEFAQENIELTDAQIIRQD